MEIVKYGENVRDWWCWLTKETSNNEITIEKINGNITIEKAAKRTDANNG